MKNSVIVVPYVKKYIFLEAFGKA